jgi:hypothetical protein
MTTSTSVKNPAHVLAHLFSVNDLARSRFAYEFASRTVKQLGVLRMAKAFRLQEQWTASATVNCTVRAWATTHDVEVEATPYVITMRIKNPHAAGVFIARLNYAGNESYVLSIPGKNFPNDFWLDEAVQNNLALNSYWGAVHPPCRWGDEIAVCRFKMHKDCFKYSYQNPLPYLRGAVKNRLMGERKAFEKAAFDAYRVNKTYDEKVEA